MLNIYYVIKISLKYLAFGCSFAKDKSEFSFTFRLCYVVVELKLGVTRMM